MAERILTKWMLRVTSKRNPLLKLLEPKLEGQTVVFKVEYTGRTGQENKTVEVTTADPAIQIYQGREYFHGIPLFLTRITDNDLDDARARVISYELAERGRINLTSCRLLSLGKGTAMFRGNCYD